MEFVCLADREAGARDGELDEEDQEQDDHVHEQHHLMKYVFILDEPKSEAFTLFKPHINRDKIFKLCLPKHYVIH